MLYKKGGVYIDIKCMPAKKLITFIEEYTMPLFVKDAPHMESYNPCIWNGFMISAPGNEIFKRCIDAVVKNTQEKSYETGALSITGPCLMGRIFKEMGLEYPSEIYNRNHVLFSGNEAIMTQYYGYRSEQRIHQKGGAHYTELYRRGKVYSC